MTMYKVEYVGFEFYEADSEEEARKMFNSDGHGDDEITEITT